MKRPKTLPAFSNSEFEMAHKLLASRVATMMGRKLEEGDWAYVYCVAKDIPNRGWSNLNMDIIYNGLGVEHKMLMVKSRRPIKHYCGTTLMHPSATRSIRIPSDEDDPTKVAQEILKQYGELIEERRRKVAESAPGKKPDLRIGWLLWQADLVEFLYFEQEMLPPNPDDFRAEWHERRSGNRKPSRNLWVYEKETGVKRFSITTSAGPKIQPYFDVPPPDDPNLYYFRVQGEYIKDGRVRVWITPMTELVLREILGSLELKVVSEAILKIANEVRIEEAEVRTFEERDIDLARPLYVTKEAYTLLRKAFAGVSDEHCMQLFVQTLAKRR